MIVSKERYREGREENENGIDWKSRPSSMPDRERDKNREVKKEMAWELAEMGFSKGAIERILNIEE